MSKPRLFWILASCFSIDAWATDDLITCEGDDPEFLDDIMAWQERNTLYVQRLDADSHLVGSKLAVDTNMPALARSFNGPELGHDLITDRYVLVYQVEDPETGDMKLASAKQRPGCSSDPYRNGCWDTPYTETSPDWIRRTYAAPLHQDRWNAFATVDDPSGLQISYVRDENNIDGSIEPRLTFLTLDEPTSTETKVDEFSATPNSIGRWMSIEGQLMGLTTVVQSGYARVALVTRDGAVTVISDLEGNASGPMIDRTPDGTYKILYRYTNRAVLHGSDPRNRVTVLSCTPDVDTTCRAAGDWSTQTHFDYHSTSNDPALNYLTSIETFHANADGEDGLYALILEADTTNFFVSTVGKIWYVKVPETGPVAAPVEVSEDVSPVPRRIEPEIHQSANGPHLIWTQRNDDFYRPECAATDGMTLVGSTPELRPPGY